MKKKKTTIVLPENLIQAAKLKAVKENSNLSSIIQKSLEKELLGITENKDETDPMKALGVFHIGIKNIYKKRSDLYDDEL